ncbi:MAG: serine hydrolase domain-containing protein [Roseovarius sp.]
MTYTMRPTPDLTVTQDNKQGWNQPDARRRGFHNLHKMYRRGLSYRSSQQLVLDMAADDALAARPEVALLTRRPECSALVVVQGQKIRLSHHAPDFAPDQQHSIQSITKMFGHLLAGLMVAKGRLDLGKPVEHYLPDIGSGYRGALVQDVLDMNVINNFVEDYDDPNADSYAQEAAMGWRLPVTGTEPTMHAFIHGITGDDLTNPSSEILYSSANTEVIALIIDQLCPGALPEMVYDVVEAAGFEHSFHISTTRDAIPALSGGGCLTATDLARFGLLLARVANGEDTGVGHADFTRNALTRKAGHMPPPRDYIRYADHVMTDGRWIGHSGYGGQFLMADPSTNTSIAYLSVLENASGFCADYMAETIAAMEALLPSAG